MARNRIVSTMAAACAELQKRLEDARIVVRNERGKGASRVKEEYVLKTHDNLFGFCQTGANKMPQPCALVCLGVRPREGKVFDFYAYIHPRKGWSATGKIRKKIDEQLKAVCNPTWTKTVPRLHHGTSYFRKWQKSIVIGASISHSAETSLAGSVGFFARRDPNSALSAERAHWFKDGADALYLISAGHVLLRDDGGALMGHLRHPARTHDKDGETSAPIADIVGGLRPSVGAEVEIDAGIARVHDESRFQVSFLGNDRVLQGAFVDDEYASFHDLAIGKRGAGNGEQSGFAKRFIGRQAFDLNGKGGIGYIENCFLVESADEGSDFSRESDSGALAYCETTNKGFGIIVGGLRYHETEKQRGQSYCIPVYSIEEQFGVRLECGK